MFGSIAKAMFGSSNDRYVKSLGKIVAQIAAYEPVLQGLSDEELGDRDVVRAEAAQAHLIQLDEPPARAVDADRQHEQRVHPQLAEDERLGRVDVSVGKGDRTRLAGTKDFGGQREVRNAVDRLVTKRDLAERVVGRVHDVVADDA